MILPTVPWAQGWVLTVLSSCLCVLGTLVIYFDDLYVLLLPRFITSKYKFQLRENYTFLNGSLAFSAGCLLFTSLARLLPEAVLHLQQSSADRLSNTVLVFSYTSGILVCLVFNALLHLITSESVVHCSHDEESHSHSHSASSEPIGKLACSTPGLDESEGSYDQSAQISEYHPDGHSHSHNEHQHSHSKPTANELTPLVSIQKRESRHSILHYITPHEESVGECKGYTSAELCLFKAATEDDLLDHEGRQKPLHFCEIPVLSNQHDDGASTHDLHPARLNHTHGPNEDHSHHAQDHHHHVNLPLSRLLLIGIQTTLAITLHKFPEGFITFITLETNPQLGVLIFLSLLMHNFTEGFSMCLPLFYLFQSSSRYWAKLKAVAISAVLGGLSQPLGALAGWVFLKYNNAGSSYNDDDTLERLDYVFGLTLAITSGFLTVIALSMYGSAVSFGGSPNFVMLWCIAGIVTIGILTIFAA